MFANHNSQNIIMYSPMDAPNFTLVVFHTNVTVVDFNKFCISNTVLQKKNT